jgi:small subunit ribosomal protein S8
MLTRIRNSVKAHKTELILPYSKFKANLAKVLEQEGFIAGSNEVTGKIKQLRIALKYTPNGDPVISGINRVSTPGQRIYLPAQKIPRTNGGLGVTVVSTSKGLLSDRAARTSKVGGEVICQIW